MHCLNLGSKNNGNHSLRLGLAEEGGKGSGPVGLSELAVHVCPTRAVQGSPELRASPACSVRARLSLVSRPSGPSSNHRLGLGDQHLVAAT